jgi:hypothetical protein
MSWSTAVLVQQVDVIFDDSYIVDSSNLLDMSAFIAAYGTEAQTLPAVVSGKVYTFNNRLAKSTDDTVSTDWFESATARPDLVSCAALHPPALSPVDPFSLMLAAWGGLFGGVCLRSTGC